MRALKEQLLNPTDDVPKYEEIENIYDLLTDESIDIATKYEAAHLLIEDIVYSKQDKMLQITYK